MTERRDVVPTGDGQWKVLAPNADRASAITDTQAQAIDRADAIVANLGGGEVNVHGKNGQMREQHTVAPGNDPRSSRG